MGLGPDHPASWRVTFFIKQSRFRIECRRSKGGINIRGSKTIALRLTVSKSEHERGNHMSFEQNDVDGNQMQCACYLRYSSDMQRKASLEDQERQCRKFAEEQGWEVLKDYR
jgi:hypothetical protein